jgi:isopenicillin-N N-acyltransferase like protein
VHNRTYALLLSICMVILVARPVVACTLFGAAGESVAGGGVLIAKNRDNVPGKQELRLIEPKKGNRYYGLFSVGSGSRALVAGINEKGLTVVSATASSASKKLLKDNPSKPRSMERIMEECSTVLEALGRTDLLKGPKFLMLADSGSVAIVEISDRPSYSVYREGVVGHTNHYVFTTNLPDNASQPPSSLRRYARINELLTNKTSFSLDDFIVFSKDQADSPAYSIWRTGKDRKTIPTLASWIVSYPKGSDPTIYCALYNNGRTTRTVRRSLTTLFGPSAASQKLTRKPS